MGGIASRAAIPLVVRPAARLGWGMVSLATLACSIAAGWVLLGLREGILSFTPIAFLGWLYWEAGVGSFKLAWHRGRAEIDHAGLIVSYPFLLSEPIRVPFELIAGFASDPRPESERKVAACVRRRSFGGPFFLEPSLPVISPHPSSHSSYGNAAAPNFVLLFADEITPPYVAKAARALLRIAAGKSDRYRGPRPGKPMRGIRLLVEDPGSLASALRDRGVAEVDQESYLRPLRRADFRKYRKERVIYALVWVGVIAVLALARIAGGS